MPVADASQPPMPSFTRLGDLKGGEFSSVAMDVSASGSTVVVGYSAAADGTQAFRWRFDGGMKALETPVFNGKRFSTAHAVSADGKWVVGSVLVGDHTPPQPCRWDQDGKLEVLSLSTPGFQAESGEAWDVSATGDTIVGQVQGGGVTRACIWRDGELSLLDSLADGWPATCAFSISANGRVIIGSSEGDVGIRGFRVAGGQLADLGDLYGGSIWCTPRSMSADGSIVVGASISHWGREASRWQDGRIVGLGGLSDHHEFFSQATGVSNDGNIIVGSSENEAGAEEAFIWSPKIGMCGLRDLLLNDCDLAEWRLTQATAVSADGLTIVGNGRNPNGQSEAWMVKLADRADQPPSDVSSPAIFSEHRVTIPNLKDPYGVAIGDDGTIHIAAAGADYVPTFDRDGRPLQKVFAGEVDSPPKAPCAVALSPPGPLAPYRIILDWYSNRLLDSLQPDSLNRPQGVLFFGKNMCITDTGNDRIVVPDHTGKPPTTWGARGEGPGQFRRPVALACDSTGNLYVADADNDRIQKFDCNGKFIATWGQRGRKPGFFLSPTGIAVWHDDVYVVDSGNHRIQVFGSDGKYKTVFGRRAMVPHEGEGRLHYPHSIAISPDGEFAVISEPLENRCQVFDRRTSEYRPPAEVIEPPARSFFGRAMDVDGSIAAVVVPESNAIELFELSTNPPRSLGLIGDQLGGGMRLVRPAGVALNVERSELVISDAGARQIVRMALDADALRQAMQPDAVNPNAAPPPLGRLVQTIQCEAIRDKAPKSTLPFPIDCNTISIDRAGALYVIDSANRVVIKLDSDLKAVQVIGNGEGNARVIDPVDLDCSHTSNQVLVADHEGGWYDKVVAFNLDGVFQFSLGFPELRLRNRVAVQGACFGPGDSISVTDSQGYVRTFDRNGTLKSEFGKLGITRGELFKPLAIRTAAQDRLVVLDWGNHRAVVFDSAGKCLGAFGAPLYVRPVNNEPEE